MEKSAKTKHCAILIASTADSPDPMYYQPGINSIHWLAYLAAYIDSEGCLGMYFKRTRTAAIQFQPILTIETTYRPTIASLAALYDVSVMARKKAQSKHKQAYRVDIYGKKLRQLLMDVLPYLQEKAPSARDILRYFSYKDIITAPNQARDSAYYQRLYARVRKAKTIET